MIIALTHACNNTTKNTKAGEEATSQNPNVSENMTESKETRPDNGMRLT